MGEIFGKLYCWFESLFGQYLAEYLWGYNCATETYDGKNLFFSIGLITLGIALIGVIAYYYLPVFFFNHPRTNRWWNWLIILLIAAIINFIIAYNQTINDFLNGNIGDCLMYVKDEKGNIISQLIFEEDCWLFGLTNFIITIIFFVPLSFVLKWWSPNCKYSPF